MSSIKQINKALDVVREYCDDDTHGYVLQSGNHNDISKGTDCAGLARLYAYTYENCSSKDYPDFGTWSMVDVLYDRGWQPSPFSYSSSKRGDLFVRALGDSTGHTVIYLGDGKIAEASNNRDGSSGDSSGLEVVYGRDYYDYGYNYMLRPVEMANDDDSMIDFKEYPLLYDGYFGPVTVRYLQQAIRKHGYYPSSKYLLDGDFGVYTKTELQKYLAYLGYYDRSVDGDFGYYSVVALQTYLKDLGVYWDSCGWCLIDGDWGTLTTIALQRALNGDCF